MRSSLGIVLVLAACAVIAALWLFVRSPAAPTPSAPVASPQIAALESEIERLREEVDRLRSVPALSEPTARTEDSPPAPAVESVRSPAIPPSPSGPDAYLDEYVASVLARNESERYRHLVAAYVVELSPRIGALIRDANSPLALRVRLIDIFGDRRLRGHAAAIDALLSLLSGTPEEQLVARALASLTSIGDPSAAVRIEQLAWSLPSRSMQHLAVATVVALAGDRRHYAMQRLLANAPSDGLRAYVLSLLDSDQPAGALLVFESASTLAQPLRLQAANGIGAFVDPSIAEFVSRWLEFETDATVRATLQHAARKLGTTPSWHARQAIGPPDANPGRDDPKAWASANDDMGEQWLELGYTPPRRCSEVRIHEVNSAGAVIAVVGIEESGAEHTLWSGVDPLLKPGVFEVKVPTTAFAVRRLRLVLDTDPKPDWNEIDCVELVGPDGRAWASEARASSWFGGSD